MTEALIQYFSNYFPLNQIEKEEVEKLFAGRQVKRRQLLLQPEDVCRYFYFVVSGCFKMYATDKKGSEHNIQFAVENDWISDLGSFYAEKPSQLYIEAVERSIILQIKKSDLVYLFTHYHKFDRNFRIIIEQKYVALQNRLLQNISATAEERYLFFLAEYAHLSNRLPNVQIASYLGITPEFLSTIRKNLSQKTSHS